ncbi:MAG: pyridoxal phosphate-dependent aminotransferase [Methanomassiliicoccus sp.]|nr:pyridoxal phosphate-dependent aminotransferase [Methanomassiliicoccus sp.]
MKDPLEEWALHCRDRQAAISMDSSGAPPPFWDSGWKEISYFPSNDEADAEARLKDELARTYGVDSDMIALTQGAQHATFLFFLTQLRPGDLAAVENPTFMPIRRQAESVCQVRTLDRLPTAAYLPREEQLDTLLAQGARVVALTNLHNPSGTLLSTDRMAEIVERAGRRRAMVLSDEVYREMAYGPVPKGAYQLGENAVSVSSVTKLNGLRGLRVGWLIGPPEVAQAVEAARLYTSYRLPAITCYYAAEAVRRRDWFRERVLRAAKENLPALSKWLEIDDRVDCRMPDGGLMAHLRLPPRVDDLEFSEWLLDRRVAVGPGRYWGSPGTIRVTFSCPRLQLEAGLGAITTLLDVRYAVME